MKALTRKDLDTMVCCECDRPSCGLVLKARCHPNAGLWFKYFKDSGTLQVLCCQAECDELVAEFEVAP